MPNYHRRFGEELRTLRRKYGLSQKMVSYFLGGTPAHTQISRYERGENLPEHRDDVEALADAIMVTSAETERLIAAYAQAKAAVNGTADQLAVYQGEPHGR